LEHFYAALGGAGAESQPEGYRQQALIRVHIARSLDALSEHEQAREFLQQALRTVADKHDPGVSCVIRLYLAWIEEHLGNRETALAMASQALGAAQSAKDPSLEADVTLLLALLNWRQGDLNRAQALCRYGLQIREEVKDAAGCARAWHCLGMIEHDRGQFQMARDCFATSARIYRQIGEGVLEAMVRVHWGDTCVAANDLAASVEQFRQAVALYQEFQGVERNPDLSLWTHPDLE
jgi:tetratricopeptide (TPR) repeat protein